jgi:hypothetical protein
MGSWIKMSNHVIKLKVIRKWKHLLSHTWEAWFLYTQEMKKIQQELDNIEKTKKQEHNKSMRPKKNNIHTVTSDNDGIVVSNKIHR